MSISKYPSKFTLPRDNPGVGSVLEYLTLKFPAIGADVWRQRMSDGKVHWHDGSLITPDSAYQSQQRVYYYREVAHEPELPFEERILFQDDEIVVADKPHFMTVIPGGIHINGCLQNRLREKTGIDTLQAVHRLDRVTAGLVLFSVNPKRTHLYHGMFNAHQVEKRYHAVANINPDDRLVGRRWEVKNRIVGSDPRFLMKVVDGEPNSHSIVHCLKQSAGRALFELKPITGRTHQLRVHMQTLGWPLLNDRYYPTLRPKSPDVYSKPLQLLAKELRFTDPVTGQPRAFSSRMALSFAEQ